MNYFDYVEILDVKRSIAIYEVVQNLKNYAITIYKSRWQDALDKAFFHILKNYDESSGDLVHYATKVIRTVLLNRTSREIESDTSLEEGITRQAVEDTNQNPLNILVRNEENSERLDMKQCLEYLFPIFIVDYRFFITNNPDVRKCSYKGLFDRFSYSVIKDAVSYYAVRYGKEMLRLEGLGRKARCAILSPEGYRDFMNPSVEYFGFLNNTLLYRNTGKPSTRIFYKINLATAVEEIKMLFYKKGKSTCHTVVEGVNIYCSPSGKIVIGGTELRKTLEREIMGCLFLQNTWFKIIRYGKGMDLLVSSSKDVGSEIPIPLINGTYFLSLERVASKKLVNK